MKILKSAVIACSLTVAMGAFSTAAVAESDPGRITYSPVDAINGISERVAAAEAAINNGASGEEVATLIKKATDFSKELNANDKVDRANSKAKAHLKEGIKSAKAGNMEETKAHINAAKEILATLKGLL